MNNLIAELVDTTGLTQQSALESVQIHQQQSEQGEAQNSEKDVSEMEIESQKQLIKVASMEVRPLKQMCLHQFIKPGGNKISNIIEIPKKSMQIKRRPFKFTQNYPAMIEALGGSLKMYFNIIDEPIVTRWKDLQPTSFLQLTEYERSKWRKLLKFVDEKKCQKFMEEVQKKQKINDHNLFRQSMNETMSTILEQPTNPFGQHIKNSFIDFANNIQLDQISRVKQYELREENYSLQIKITVTQIPNHFNQVRIVYSIQLMNNSLIMQKT